MSYNSYGYTQPAGYSQPTGGSTSYSASYSYSSTSGEPSVTKVTTSGGGYGDFSSKPYDYGGSTYSTTTQSYGTGTGGYGGSTGGSVGGALGGLGYGATSKTGYGATSTTGYAPYSSTSYTQNASAPSYGTSTSNYGTAAAKKPDTNQQTQEEDPNPKSKFDPISLKHQKPLKVDLSPGAIENLSEIGKQLFSNSFAKSATGSAFQDLIKQLKSSGQKYRDFDFPAELRSLTGGLSNDELAASGNPLNWNSLVWLRADDIYGKGNYQIFQGQIEPNDIKQGALGDCYFLSTLASLAEKSDRIKRLFETDQPNEQGCYGVKVCDTGVWTTVLLDDFFPCSAKSKQPCFTKGNGNEIWVQLLEKAWSKIYGSYARIEAGLTRECLHDLTGAPTKYYLTGDPQKYDEIWDAIATGEKKNFAMTCGAGDFFEGADLMSSIGLVGSHAYSLLAALTVRDKYGKEVKLVKLRNPWGQGEWTGDWSDKSDQWTPELKRQLQVEDRDDGIFFMTYEDMLKYFSDIQICKIHDDFTYKSLKSNCDGKHAVFFKITVKVGGHYYITVNQESKRKHAEKEEYEYSEAYLVFGKKNGNNYEYIEGYQKADKEVWTDGHLNPGEYIVYAKIAWNDKKKKEFSISSYGQGDVEIEQVPKTYCPDFLEKVYIDKARKAKKMEDYKHCGVNNCYRVVELTDDGFGFIYYRNESQKTLEEELFFKYLEGLKFRKPQRGNNYKISVPGGQERIVITKVIPKAPRIRQAFTEKARFV